MMFFGHNGRSATSVRLIGLALIIWSIVTSSQPPALHGRGLVVSIAFVGAVAAWLCWTARPGQAADEAVTPDLYVMAIAGGVLSQADQSGAGSAFAFVAVVAAGFRGDLGRTWPLPVLAGQALAVSGLIYGVGAVGVLAYCLGFAGSALGGSAARQSRLRAEQAELLLVQSQRSQEEALRAARLEESTRLAREIHDVLAHSLAGLTIQLEATTALVENGADRDAILARVRRAHELARAGLQETRRAVGALRGETPSVPEALRALVSDHRTMHGTAVAFALDAEPAQLAGDGGQAVLRVVQESLTNIAKHAPGATVAIAVTATGSELVATIEDERPAAPVAAGPVSATGGGYGLRGMRERAQALGGGLTAGPTDHGWCVELRVPLTEPTGPAPASASTEPTEPTEPAEPTEPTEAARSR
jgi:signal transduction histidine kinase